MQKPKRILLVSYGSIGQRHLRNCIDLLPDAEVCIFRHKPGQDTPDNVQVVYTLEDALAFKPDAAILASPASKHAEVALPLVQQNCNVFIEKPLESDVTKVEGLREAVDACQAFVMVGYVLRFQPIMGYLKTYIDQGSLGQVRTATVQTGQYLPDWRPDSDYRQGVSAQKHLGGGVLLELSHELDYAAWFFGIPNSLMCSTARLSGLDMEVEDCAQVLYEYPDKRVMIQVDFLQRAAQMELKVIGSEATLKADLIAETAQVFSPEHPKGIALDVLQCAAGNEIYLRQFDVFFAKSFTDYAPRFSGSRGNQDWVCIKHAQQVLGIVDAAKASDATGQRVQIT